MSKLTVVISQSQGKNPAKRQLEEELAAALLMDPDVDVSLVPHLYDMDADHTGMLFLRSAPGNLVVLGWMYPRAIRWILDRQGVKGREGVTLLDESDDEDDDFDEDSSDEEDDGPRGIGSVDVPDRNVYCIDMRNHSEPQVYLDEIRRIAQEQSTQTVDLMQWIQGDPKQAQLERFLRPAGQESANSQADDSSSVPGNNGQPTTGNGQHTTDKVLDFAAEKAGRRWYPVIDYDRCTNCMECIDFCLFGVYGVDKHDRILVEQQDNCKKGCPACSRVCPENAIIFPGHKTPAIAGADGEVGGLKIDLSKLFGGPEKSALETAVEERDAELVKDGREAVGMAVGIPKRQEGKEPQERDELDDLMDGLDDMEV